MKYMLEKFCMLAFQSDTTDNFSESEFEQHFLIVFSKWCVIYNFHGIIQTLFQFL